MGILFLYPFFELGSLYWLGHQIGLANLFLYLLATFFVGSNLVRSAGINSLKMASPSIVLEAPFRLMAGVLILVPGLISDVLAVLILIPIVRKLLWTMVFAKIFKGRVYQQTWTSGGFRQPYPEGDVVDVTAVREERDVSPMALNRNTSSLDSDKL